MGAKYGDRKKSNLKTMSEISPKILALKKSCGKKVLEIKSYYFETLFSRTSRIFYKKSLEKVLSQWKMNVYMGLDIKNTRGYIT